MVWNASDTSTVVKTLAFIGKGSFSSMVGIVYLGLLIALFMVWLGSIQIRSLPFGFSLTSILDSQSVGWVTGLIIPLLQKAFSALHLPGLTFPQALGVLGHETGVTEESSWICISVPRGFPRHGLDTLAYCRKMSSAVSIPSGGSVCGVCGISSSTAFLSSA